MWVITYNHKERKSLLEDVYLSSRVHSRRKGVLKMLMFSVECAWKVMCLECQVFDDHFQMCYMASIVISGIPSVWHSTHTQYRTFLCSILSSFYWVLWHHAKGKPRDQFYDSEKKKKANLIAKEDGPRSCQESESQSLILKKLTSALSITSLIMK